MAVAYYRVDSRSFSIVGPSLMANFFGKFVISRVIFFAPLPLSRTSASLKDHKANVVTRERKEGTAYAVSFNESGIPLVSTCPGEALYNV